MTAPTNSYRNRIICDLRHTGMSASAIAAQVGCTRNAVIGVWWRAGMAEPNGRKGIARDRW